MLKCSSERCVCAPQSLSTGTSTTPRLSVSLRDSVIWTGLPVPFHRCHSNVVTLVACGSSSTLRASARRRARRSALLLAHKGLPVPAHHSDQLGSLIPHLAGAPTVSYNAR